jgi:soluble lytic murein transglycosylase-like protein
MKGRKRFFLYPLFAIVVLASVAWLLLSDRVIGLKSDGVVDLRLSLFRDDASPIEDPRPLFLWVFARSNRISQETAREIAFKAARTRRPLLILALIEVESNFVPTAVSSKGAVGLSQIVFEHHGKALAKAGIAREKRDLFDVGPSILAADLILDDMLAQSGGDVVKALEKYLGGQDGAYVKRILTNLASLYILTTPAKERP